MSNKLMLLSCHLQLYITTFCQRSLLFPKLWKQTMFQPLRALLFHLLKRDCSKSFFQKSWNFCLVLILCQKICFYFYNSSQMLCCLNFSGIKKTIVLQVKNITYISRQSNLCYYVKPIQLWYKNTIESKEEQVWRFILKIQFFTNSNSLYINNQQFKPIGMKQATTVYEIGNSLFKNTSMWYPVSVF